MNYLLYYIFSWLTVVLFSIGIITMFIEKTRKKAVPLVMFFITAICSVLCVFILWF